MRANLLQITGDAVVTQFYSMEGKCNIALHLEVYNPSATRTVQIVDHKRYYLTPGGWREQGPWGSSDFYTMGSTFAPLQRRTYDTGVAGAWDVGLGSYLVLDVQLSSGTYTENQIVQIPITITPDATWSELSAGTPAPPPPPGRMDPLSIQHGTYPILMQDPVDVFPVMDGSQSWLVLTGQIPNPWGTSLQLNSFSYVLEDGIGGRSTGSLPLSFKTDAGTTVDLSTQASTAGMFSFNHAIVIPAAATGQWQWVTLTAGYHLPSWPPGVGVLFTRRIPIAQDARTPHALRYPVDDLPGGDWTAWNQPVLDGFTLHNTNQSERYALDLVAEKANNTVINPAASDADNTNFYAYGKAVRAMDDGTIISVRKDVPDGLGRHGYSLPRPGGLSWPSNIPAGGNVIVLQHANNRYSLYAHLIPESPTNTYPAVGTSVTAGQQIGLLGNSGSSSEPHLHVAYWSFDPITGFHRALPMAFGNVTNLAGTALPGVIAGDNHVKVQ